MALGRCLELAAEAGRGEDVPVGAVVFSAQGTVLGEGFNTRERDADPAGHAEIAALRAAASSLGTWRLDGCVLAVTLEPCPMCAGAIYQSRIGHVIFGAWDEKAGAAGSVFDILREPRLNHWVEVHPGVRAEECAAQLRAFFEAFRG
ncbi:nucleoside deaminase [Nesterenkonia sandarakina]|uniref:nucleoside deaminase n=1 Tax=Nesterenkonia sandarakina TaxID=272918 RepID=UPI0031B5924B